MGRIGDAGAAATAAAKERALQLAHLGGGRASGFTTRASQVLAAFLLPFLVVIYMAVSAAVYLAFTSILYAIGLNGVPGTGALNFLLAIALLAGAPILLAAWVRSGGFGLMSFD